MTNQELLELLPWYANGTLDPEETRAVESYLEREPEGRQELAELRVLQGVVETVGEHEPQFNPQGIQDALRRVKAYEAGQRSKVDLFTRLRDWFQRAYAWLRRSSRSRASE